MKPGKCNTATLIRGRTYTIKSIKFERGVPRRIEEEEFLRLLEAECDEVPDGEGEIFAKPRFRIDRNVDDPGISSQGPKRLSATRQVKTQKPKRRRRRVSA